MDVNSEDTSQVTAEEVLKDWDSSFDYYFRSDCPDQHVRTALKQLLAHRTGDESESKAEPTIDDLNRVRWLIATNPNTPPPVLDHLVRRGDPALLERIAENPRTRPTTLANLAFHPSPEVRVAVAENSNTPIESIEMLAADESADVRYRLAESPEVPEEILQVLAEDENPYVAY